MLMKNFIAWKFDSYKIMETNKRTENFTLNSENQLGENYLDLGVFSFQINGREQLILWIQNKELWKVGKVLET